MVNTALNPIVRLLALIILLGVVVYIYMLSTAADAAGLREKIARISPAHLVAPVGLSLLSYFLRFIRWRLILKQLGHCLSIKSDLIYYLSGFALTMTPGKSGETIRSAFLTQARVPLHTSLSAFVLERSFDLLVVGTLATLLFTQPLYTLMFFLIALTIIAFVAVKILRLEQRLAALDTPGFWRRLLNIIIHASVALKPKSVALYALLGCAAWTAQGLGFYCIVRLFTEGLVYQDLPTQNLITTELGRQSLGVQSAIGTYCSGLFLGAVSLIPGGIGVTEGSLSWLLQSQGLDQNSAILSALVSRGCTLWLAVAIGCVALAAIIKGFAAK